MIPKYLERCFVQVSKLNLKYCSNKCTVSVKEDSFSHAGVCLSASMSDQFSFNELFKAMQGETS